MRLEVSRQESTTYDVKDGKRNSDDLTRDHSVCFRFLNLEL